MASIFLSYAHENRTCAEALAKVLESAGYDVWWDRRLGGGEEFSAEIEAAVEQADAVVVAWSKESIKSRWVRDEAAVGCERQKLVPVSIDGSVPPMGFRQFHTLDLTRYKGAKSDRRTTEFLQAVDRRLQGKEAAGPVQTQHRPRLSLASGKMRWAALGSFLLVAIAGIGLFLFVGRDWLSGPSPTPTIGLLPFTSASADDELRQLGVQSRESIAHSFAQSGVPVRLMDSTPKDSSQVDFLISADFSKNGDKVFASVRLDEAAQRITVFSDRFEATKENVRDLPELIGAQMAGNLTWNAPMMVLDRRQPIEPSLMAELLKGSDFTADPFGLGQYLSLKRVVAKAPDLPIALLSLAFQTSFVLDQIPRGERAEAVEFARRAADRAIKLKPEFGDTYATWCLLHSETRMVECEDRLRDAKRIDPDAPFLNSFLSSLLLSVGRFDEALELARLSHSRDVYVPMKIAWMLQMQEYAGDGEEARALFEQGARWWPEYQPLFVRNRVIGLLDSGHFDAILRLEREIGPKQLPEGYEGSSGLVTALKAKSIPAAKRVCSRAERFLMHMRCMIVLATLGDQDGSYAIADEFYPRRFGRTAAESDRIWLDAPTGVALLEFITSPAAAPMRRDPRYMQLVQRVGLLDYWRKGRLPDFCRKQPEHICKQIKGRG